MTADRQALDQVKSYLATLSPKLRAKLFGEIEARRANGTGDAAQAVLLRLLREVMRDKGEDAGPTITPQQVFCAPLEPFLVDGAGTTKHKGLIARQSLDAVWRWLQREPPLADALAQASYEADRALLAGDEERAAAIMARLRADAVPVIDAALEAAADDPRRRVALTMQLEGGQTLDDLPDILAVLRLEERIARVTAKLPETIAELDDGLIATIARRMKDAGDEMLYLLIPVYRRLESPAQIIRVLTVYEGTDDGARLGRSRFAPCVDLMLSEIDFAAEQVAAHVGRPAEFEALLAAVRRFYALANGLGVAVELEGAPEWRKRLAAQRRRASEILSAEVQRIPGAVRRAIRARRRDGTGHGPVSEDDVQEAEYAVRLMVALRPYRGEFAVNELLGTVAGQVEKYVEAASGSIVEEVRGAKGAALEQARRDLDVAVRINAVIFGAEYAALLKRSAGAAGPLPTRPAGDEEAVPEQAPAA